MFDNAEAIIAALEETINTVKVDVELNALGITNTAEHADLMNNSINKTRSLLGKLNYTGEEVEKFLKQ